MKDLVSVFYPMLRDGINRLPYQSVVGTVLTMWRDDRSERFFRRVLEITDDTDREWRVSLEEADGNTDVIGGVVVMAVPANMVDAVTPAIVLQTLVSAFSFHKCMGDLCPLNGQSEECIYAHATRVVGAFRDMVDAVLREEERPTERVAFLDAVHAFISLYSVFIKTWTKARIIRDTQELIRIKHLPASVFATVESAGTERRTHLWRELRDLMHDDPVALEMLTARVEGVSCPEVVLIAEDMGVTPKWALLHKLALDRSAVYGPAESARLFAGHYSLVFRKGFFGGMTADLQKGGDTCCERVLAFLFVLKMELSFLVGDAELVELADMISAEKWAVRFTIRGHSGFELSLAATLRDAVVKVLCNGHLLLHVSEVRNEVHKIWMAHANEKLDLLVRLAEMRLSDDAKVIRRAERMENELEVALLVRMCRYVVDILCVLRVDMDNRSLRRLRESVGSCAATICSAFENMMAHNDETLKELPRFIEPMVLGDMEKRAFTGEMLANGQVAGSTAYRAFLATAFKHRLFDPDTRVAAPDGSNPSPPLIMFAETGRLMDLWGPGGALRRSVISVACFALTGTKAKCRWLPELVQGIREGAEPTALPFPRYVIDAVVEDFSHNTTGICRRVVREMRNRIIQLKDVKYEGDPKIQKALDALGGAVDAAIVEVDNMAVLHVEIFHGWYHTTICGLLGAAELRVLESGVPDPRSIAEWNKVGSMSTRRIRLKQSVVADEPDAKRARV